MNPHRRDFLRTVAAGALAAASLANEPRGTPDAGQSLKPILLPKTGLKITGIETYTRGPNLSIVRVVADDGSEGFGQAAPYDADITATVLHRKIAPFWLGQDPGDLRLLVQQSIETNYKFPWSFVCRATSGVETAVLDLLGKKAGKSVCALLGGEARPLPVYGSSMSRTISPEQEAERMKRLKGEKGFTAFKIRIGKVVGHDEDEWTGRTEALVPAVRQAVGKDTVLLADGNGCYTPKKAIEVGKLLEKYDFRHFEEPCPFWELEWTAKVAKALRIPIAGGEQDNDLAQFRRMIRMGAVDIVQPDVCYLGGVLRTVQVAQMAAEKKLKCVPHSANLSMLMVFTLHIFAAISNPGDRVEWTIESDKWTQSLHSPVMEVRDGKVEAPEGPGWGVRINPEWLAAATKQESRVTG
jgi:L-alanine-DL-glutamate epimerase-like enolase superfamily enzyme